MTFEPGQTVRLKSGGPLMTVEQVAETSYNGLGVWCVWFDKVGNKQVVGRDTFNPVLLELATKGPAVAAFVV